MPIYPVSEDTLLLLDHLRCGKRVLEVGTGSGIIAVECARRGSEVVAVDISEEAVMRLAEEVSMEGLNIQVIRSDLFENVHGRFDTVIFNPPYLPGDAEGEEDLQWAGGGEHGDEIIFRFLAEVGNYLEKDGEIYLVLSSFNRIDEMKRRFPFKFEELARMKLSFHEIYVYRLTRA